MHHLVRAYLGYEPPTLDWPVIDDTGREASEATPQQGFPGTSALPSPPGLHSGSTTDESLRAFERLFYGEVKDVQQI